MAFLGEFLGGFLRPTLLRFASAVVTSLIITLQKTGALVQQVLRDQGLCGLVAGAQVPKDQQGRGGQQTGLRG